VVTDSADVEHREDIRPSAARGALAGFLGAGAALVAIEFVSLIDARGISVTEAIQNRFIKDFAGSLKQTAIDWFGQNDKLALQIGTAIVVLLLGAIVGAVARTRWQIVVGVFVAFAVLGIVVAWSDPRASNGVAIASAVIGAAVGGGVAIGLERRWRLAPGPDRGTASDLPVLSRRSVLVNAGGGAAVLLLGAWIARSARGSIRVGAKAVSKVLPKPSKVVPVPATQPFSVDGLSSYVTPSADFYRIDTAISVPLVDADSWQLRITGMVDHPRTYSFEELIHRHDLIEVPVTLQCVSNEIGGNLVGNARWTGVPLRTLLAEAGVKHGADEIIGESVDGFTAGFPTKVALDGRQALVAIGMNGRTLPSEHGYPARLVVPGLYGYVSATKWLKEIRLTTFAQEAGYWVPLGWSRLGPIKTMSRIDVPSQGDQLDAGTQAVAGMAWAPTRGIRKVEVSIDDGPWREAELGRVASEDTWVQWKYAWPAKQGNHLIAVRATDGDGHVQTVSEAPPEPNGATGHHTIQVAVG
jgi:DMSO/TMAO reductase YedYZ molybdopterin-dependent catalytic subunit